MWLLYIQSFIERYRFLYTVHYREVMTLDGFHYTQDSRWPVRGSTERHCVDIDNKPLPVGDIET